MNPSVRLPTRVGFDLNDCEKVSLLEKLEVEHGFKRDVPTMFISEVRRWGACRRSRQYGAEEAV